MAAESQEARNNLPRNRKCGNCRFYEPAPLWRKGWCRNPKLYPPHANHLVDATSIDCEGGFRSRIYWEPMPSDNEIAAAADTTNQPATPIYQINNRATEPATIAPANIKPPKMTRPTVKPPIAVSPNTEIKSDEDDEDDTVIDMKPALRPTMKLRKVKEPEAEPEPLGPRMPVRRMENIETSTAAAYSPPEYEEAEIGPEPQEKDWRLVVRNRIPATKNLPLEKVGLNSQNILPWALVGVLTLITLVVVINGLTSKTNTNANNNSAVATATLSSSTVGSRTNVASTSNNNPNATVAPGAVGSKDNTPVTALATATVPSTDVKPPNKTGLVSGVGTVPLNIRELPSTSGKLVTTAKEGDRVTILEGPTDADGRSWYRIEFNGKTGWAAKDFVTVQP